MRAEFSVGKLTSVLAKKTQSDLDRVFKGTSKTRDRLSYMDEVLALWRLDDLEDTLDELEINMATTSEEKEFFDEPFDVALDSGAGDHVTAEKDAPNYEVEPSKGSKMCQNCVTACKQKLANRGQVNLRLRSGQRARGKGTDIKTVFQIADVKRPLWSVSKICDAGFTVKFTRDRAVVLDKKGKTCVTFERRGGLYVARLMMKNPKFKKNEDFHRPGK